MGESSSSSDEETNRKLRLAVWDVKQSHTYFTNDKSAGKSANQSKEDKKPQASLRPSRSEPEFSEDYGGIKATPELKSFVAKKLTTFLDGVIREYTSDSSKPSETDYADDFRLFSTSKPHDPANVVASVDLKKQSKRKEESSSDSDSDEERRKLASVAVSMDDVIRAQRILSAVEESKPAQVIISNPSPATSANSKGCADVARMEVESKLEGLQKRKKKKKKKTEDLDHGSHTNHSSSDLVPGSAKMADKTSHDSSKRKHSHSSLKKMKTEDSVEDTDHQQDNVLYKESNGEMNSQMEEVLKKKRKKKSKKSLDSVSVDHNLNDTNLQQNELDSVKKKKQKKSKYSQV
ncbi:uncharacterized protein [Amphiura filiformis]|uniref:uncharacterized protein n=1 Tax=Amphiura filiformis TaxID=82378 RepID=UPI003B221260